MIAEEMEKFREKQAQRDKELEDERRRKLQAKVQEAQALEKTFLPRSIRRRSARWA